MAKTEYKKSDKPYFKPTLTIYGKVQELTQAVGMKGHMDGGTRLGSMMTQV